ncbi:hypothetical protein D9611_010340 [Ephemerocybe angulata]|uniref:BTB domain-containing protein n=1 Tax=Ephemerocybe angulata TaxID=980116 RepID=A0A8H5F1F2_9AGAR|nr:hypothetical protein D9611_010340 [Tulosesus angulatus]
MSEADLNLRPTESSTPPDSRSAVKRGRFYHDTVAFEVEGIVHRVCRYGFEKWSQSVFPDMFSLPQGPNVNGVNSREGVTDENPIKLVGCTNDEFECLVEVMYPMEFDGAEEERFSMEQWTGVLKLARLWDMPRIANHAILWMSKKEMSAVEKVKLGTRYSVPTWIEEGYCSLVTDITQASLEEMKMLGWETMFRLLTARGEVSRHPSVARSTLWFDGELYCGHCIRQKGVLSAVAEPSNKCANCSRGYGGPLLKTSDGWGVYINTLRRAPTESYMDAKSAAVRERILELFKDELDEAQKANAIAIESRAVNSETPGPEERAPLAIAT